MPQVALLFDDPVNSSLQVGDIVYYASNPTPLPNSNIKTTTTGSVKRFGSVYSITTNPNSVNVVYDTGVAIPTANDYIMFEKDKQVNSSSLIGYYASVELKNTSDGKIELFSLASGVTESSK